MRTLLYLAAAVLVVAGVVWLLRLSAERGRQLAARDSAPALPTAEGDLEEGAAIAYGPDRGTGVLRLTPSQLVFTAASGRVLVIERLDIIGVTDTTELPDRVVAAPVLAVATADAVHYFAVARPAEWEQRLR